MPWHGVCSRRSRRARTQAGTGDRFTDALTMSLMVTLATVVVALGFAFLAAVAVSRFRFRGRYSFVVTLLLIQMIPVEGLFISQYKMLEGMQLLNTVAGLTLVYVASVLPFTIWTLRGFVAGVPYELEEAAMIDGCSRVQAFFRVPRSRCSRPASSPPASSGSSRPGTSSRWPSS